MVFGTTYCPISHLPIEDGDKCILIPLGFRMQHEFDKWNKADINCFAYLHTFIGEAVEVEYGGNYSVVKYIHTEKYRKKGNEYDEHELFMLVHYGFYQKIIAQKSRQFETIDHLPLFNTVYPIWEKANEIQSTQRNILQEKIKEKGISKQEKEERMRQYMQIPTPEWLKNLFKVADFMGMMGIAPHPVFRSDQHQTGELYEQMRAEFVKLKQ